MTREQLTAARTAATLAAKQAVANLHRFAPSTVVATVKEQAFTTEFSAQCERFLNQ